MASRAEETVVERDELVEYLTNICAYAKRQQYITARLSTDPPTAWDKAHRLMDGPLDDLAWLCD